MDISKTIAAIPHMSAKQRAGVRCNAEQSLGDPTLADKAREMLAALDRQAEVEAEGLSEHIRQLPMALRVVEAFNHEPMTETERRLIQVLLDHPGSSSEGLSRALDWRAQSWHMHFGEMCKRRQARLWPAAKSEIRDAAFYSGILAELSPENRWSFKPEVIEALAELGLRPARSE